MASPQSLPATSAGPFGDVRTTIIIPHELDRNLQVLGVQNEKTKNDIVKEALRSYVAQAGLDPDRIPKIRIE